MARVQQHDVCLVAPVALLDDVVADLAAALTEPVGTSIELRVGLHRPGLLAAFAPRRRSTLRIGIQTEHILDFDGRAMWKQRLADRIRQQVETFDIVLDLSEANRPLYSDLPENVQSRIHFGPHIFPGTARPPAISPDGPLLFFGTMNERRKRLLQELRQDGVSIYEVPGKTFGSALQSEMTKGAGILNLHFADGVYTEAPRILKAMLAGLPVASEILAPPFVEDAHYVSLSGAASATTQSLAETYTNMCRCLTEGYSLLGFLRRVARDRGLLT